MGLPESYLVTTKNVESFFNSVQSGQAPEKFTQKFLDQLGFSSSNDRLYIKLIKELGFLDDTGVPLERYYAFLDSTQARTILAEAISETYSDLFTIKRDAQNYSEEEIKNKLKTLTQGKKSENVIKLMARTFKSLCDYADWEIVVSEQIDTTTKEQEIPIDNTLKEKHGIAGGLHYNIQIHLPESRDTKVYDAIFESLRRHLL